MSQLAVLSDATNAKAPYGRGKFLRIEKRAALKKKQAEQAERVAKLERGVELYRKGGISIAAAAAKVEVSKASLQRRTSGAVSVDASLGRRPTLSAIDLAAISDDCTASQRCGTCSSKASFKSKIQTLAKKNGKPFHTRGSPGISRSTMYSIQWKIDDLYPGRFAWNGLAKPTAAQRTLACLPKNCVDFAELVEKEYKKRPYLTEEKNRMLTLVIDEKGFNNHPDKQKAAPCVVDKELMQTTGVARARAPNTGGQKVSISLAIGGDGHIYSPGFYIAGERVQLSWTDPSQYGYPPGVDADSVSQICTLPTPVGKATRNTFPKMLDYHLGTARRRLAEVGVPKETMGMLWIDGDGSHHIDKKTGEVPRAISAVMLRHGFELLKFPPATTTKYCVNDLGVNLALEQGLWRLWQSIGAVHAPGGQWSAIDPSTFEVVERPWPIGAEMAPPPVSRSLGLEPKINGRTVILGALAYINNHRKELKARAVSAWKNCGLLPFNKQKIIYGKHEGTHEERRAVQLARMSSRPQRSQPELQTKREKVIKLLEESKTLQQAEAEIRVSSALTLLASIPTSIGALKAAALAPVEKAKLKLSQKNMTLGRNGTITNRTALLASYNARKERKVIRKITKPTDPTQEFDDYATSESEDAEADAEEARYAKEDAEKAEAEARKASRIAAREAKQRAKIERQKQRAAAKLLRLQEQKAKKNEKPKPKQPKRAAPTQKNPQPRVTMNKKARSKRASSDSLTSTKRHCQRPAALLTPTPMRLGRNGRQIVQPAWLQ